MPKHKSFLRKENNERQNLTGSWEATRVGKTAVKCLITYTYMQPGTRGQQKHWSLARCGVINHWRLGSTRICLLSGRAALSGHVSLAEELCYEKWTSIQFLRGSLEKILVIKQFIIVSRWKAKTGTSGAAETPGWSLIWDRKRGLMWWNPLSWGEMNGSVVANGSSNGEFQQRWEAGDCQIPPESSLTWPALESETTDFACRQRLFW